MNSYINAKNFQKQSEEPEECSTSNKTLDCIDDVYNNHGWVSVWAEVQSYVLPQTAVAIAAACAYDAVTDSSCSYYTSIP